MTDRINVSDLIGIVHQLLFGNWPNWVTCSQVKYLSSKKNIAPCGKLGVGGKELLLAEKQLLRWGNTNTLKLH